MNRKTHVFRCVPSSVPLLHMPSMQTHPDWVRFMFVMKIVSFIDILMTFD